MRRVKSASASAQATNEEVGERSRSALIHPTNIEIWEGDLRKFPAERPVWRGKHVNEHCAILLP
jgi:hypothetical protein